MLQNSYTADWSIRESKRNNLQPKKVAAEVRANDTANQIQEQVRDCISNIDNRSRTLSRSDSGGFLPMDENTLMGVHLDPRTEFAIGWAPEWMIDPTTRYILPDHVIAALAKKQLWDHEHQSANQILDHLEERRAESRKHRQISGSI